jgi:EAL domain-containing protein (putative c-di-GMP-specific phosphodiesterase class I)
MPAHQDRSAALPWLLSDAGEASSAHRRAALEALAELGIDATPLTRAEAGEELRSAQPNLVVLEAAQLLALLRHGVEHSASGDSLPDQVAFAETARRVLAAAQPPHDQIAVLYVRHRSGVLAQSDRERIGQELVQRLRSCVRGRDAIGTLGAADDQARLAVAGEDSFTVLLPGLPRAHVAYTVGQRILEQVQAPIALDSGEVVRLDCTLGIALHPTDARDATLLVDQARQAQCAVASEAPSGVRFFSAAMNSAVLQRLALENALRSALERRELQVHYQPKVEIATGRIMGAEALVRWRHADLGNVSPAIFIPIAEELGLISAIGDFVLETACRQTRAWQSAGLPAIRMAVNLSALQLREERLIDTLTRVLADTGLPADLLELELTESTLLQDSDATLRKLQQIRKLGVHLAIDDFGTGYSSLAYLKRFPIETLKIDQAFVRNLTSDPDDASITTSIILMGKSLKLQIVAEGVETRSQLSLLSVLECDVAQGYLFGRPTEAGSFAELLRKGIDPALVPKRPGR